MASNIGNINKMYSPFHVKSFLSNAIIIKAAKVHFSQTQENLADVWLSCLGSLAFLPTKTL